MALLQPPGFSLRPRRGGDALLSGLMAYWKLDEASGARADAAGGYHLSAVGSPGRATGHVHSYAADMPNTAADYLERNPPGALDLGNVDFTLAAWVYIYSFPTFGHYRIVAGTQGNPWSPATSFASRTTTPRRGRSTATAWTARSSMQVV